jgi:hypothetical protein
MTGHSPPRRLSRSTDAGPTASVETIVTLHLRTSLRARTKATGTFHLPGGRRLEFRALPRSLFQQRGGEIVLWMAVLAVLGLLLLVSGFVLR